MLVFGTLTVERTDFQRAVLFFRVETDKERSRDCERGSGRLVRKIGGVFVGDRRADGDAGDVERAGRRSLRHFRTEAFRS